MTKNPAPKLVENPEKIIKRLKAQGRKYETIIKQHDKEADITDKIVSVVKDSIESIPPIEVPELHIYSEAQQEEVAVLLMSDAHIGKQTASYNHKVFAKRLEVLQNSMMSIVTAHRSIRPIKKLVIVMNGDKLIMSPNPANSVKLPTPEKVVDNAELGRKSECRDFTRGIIWLYHQMVIQYRLCKLCAKNVVKSSQPILLG